MLRQPQVVGQFEKLNPEKYKRAAKSLDFAALSLADLLGWLIQFDS